MCSSGKMFWLEFSVDSLVLSAFVLFNTFFSEKKERTRNFLLKEKDKKTRDKNRLTSLTSRSYLKQRRRRSFLRCTASAVRHLRERVGCVTMRAELDVQMRAELVVRQG